MEAISQPPIPLAARCSRRPSRPHLRLPHRRTLSQRLGPHG